MRPQSCKAKGRRFQQEIRDELMEIGRPHGLEDGDIRSTSMGANGEDLQFSPAADRLFGPLASECKNVESLNVVATFVKHAEKYAKKIPVLFHKRNRTEPMVTISLKYYLHLLKKEITANGR